MAGSLDDTELDGRDSDAMDIDDMLEESTHCHSECSLDDLEEIWETSSTIAQRVLLIQKSL